MDQHERSALTGLSARPALAHRYATPNPNSSAFSASANANEDWTKISDLSERRRIQNRIAQRNYRESKLGFPAMSLGADRHIGKKLKKRLQELEHRASVSPEPETRQDVYNHEHRSATQSFGTTSVSSTRYSPERYSRSPEPSYPHSPDQASYLALPDDRLRGRTHPSFSYTSYGGSENTTGPYPHSPAPSSTYTMPSPPLSAVSYDDSSYLNPMIRHQSLPHTTSDMRSEPFNQEYNTYNYHYGVIDDKQRHLSAPSAFASYPDANYTYVRPPYSRTHTR